MKLSDQIRERLRRLCVKATCRLEDLHQPVARGQAPSVTAQRYRAIARELRTAAKEFSGIANSIDRELVANTGRKKGSRQR